MNFDFAEIETVSFGVCTRQSGDVQFLDVSVTDGVRTAIGEMATNTTRAMRSVSESPTAYEASERYAGPQHLRVGLDDPVAAFFDDLQQVASFEPGGNILRREPRTVFCYFGKFVDSNGRNLIGVRRSSSFKGVLSQKPRMMSLVRDELQMVSDDLFRLDSDFDLLIDDEQVCILRVAGFELIGGLQDAIKEAAAENVQALGSALPFVDISMVDPQSFNITTARQLAAVRQQQLNGITLDSLRNACDENEVHYSLANGRLEFGEDSIGDLLDVLDRRLYTDGLVPGNLTRYKAGSRHKRS